MYELLQSLYEIDTFIIPILQKRKPKLESVFKHRQWQSDSRAQLLTPHNTVQYVLQAKKQTLY